MNGFQSPTDGTVALAQFDHAPAENEPVNEHDARRRARYGQWLFAIYLVLYAGFMMLNVFAPETTSLAWILLSGDTYKDVYGLAPALSPVPFSQPGIVTIPLGFAVLVVVSLLTQNNSTADHGRAAEETQI
jgi:hypothetical protein